MRDTNAISNRISVDSFSELSETDYFLHSMNLWVKGEGGNRKAAQEAILSFIDSQKYSESGEYLILRDLELTELPQDIGLICENVCVLELDNNDLGFTNTLPDSLVNCRCLDRLSLTGNNLSKIPELISELPEGLELDLSNNMLSEIDFGDIPNVEYLKLRENSIEKIRGSEASNIRRLDLSGNIIRFIENPSSFSKLSHVLISIESLGSIAPEDLRSFLLPEEKREESECIKLKIVDITDSDRYFETNTRLVLEDLVSIIEKKISIPKLNDVVQYYCKLQEFIDGNDQESSIFPDIQMQASSLLTLEEKNEGAPPSYIDSPDIHIQLSELESSIEDTTIELEKSRVEIDNIPELRKKEGIKLINALEEHLKNLKIKKGDLERIHATKLNQPPAEPFPPPLPARPEELLVSNVPPPLYPKPIYKEVTHENFQESEVYLSPIYENSEEVRNSLSASEVTLGSLSQQIYDLQQRMKKLEEIIYPEYMPIPMKDTDGIIWSYQLEIHQKQYNELKIQVDRLNAFKDRVIRSIELEKESTNTSFPQKQLQFYSLDQSKPSESSNLPQEAVSAYAKQNFSSSHLASSNLPQEEVSTYAKQNFSSSHLASSNLPQEEVSTYAKQNFISSHLASGNLPQEEVSTYAKQNFSNFHSESSNLPQEEVSAYAKQNFSNFHSESSNLPQEEVSAYAKQNFSSSHLASSNLPQEEVSTYAKQNFSNFHSESSNLPQEEVSAYAKQNFSSSHLASGNLPQEEVSAYAKQNFISSHLDSLQPESRTDETKFDQKK